MRALDLDFLEELRARHHRLENLAPDPLIFARGYDDPLEGETAGIIAAALAYGRVEKIVEALGFVFSRLGPSPRKAILTLRPEELPEIFAGFTYRFNKTADLSVFILLLKRTIENGQSLRAIFETAEGDYAAKLVTLCDTVMTQDPRPLIPSREVPRNHPARYLMTSPAGGSAAKRLCLFMRWMIRRDELDPGYWEGAVEPSGLVVPLDTHVAKVGRTFKMTSRKSSDWRTANEITRRLADFYPKDPLRYDFSLFRYGMNHLK